MLFTLIRYTEEWESGPTIELPHVPRTGEMILLGDSHRRQLKLDDDGPYFYYVDNVAYAEEKLDAEDLAYLFVRRYTGYGTEVPENENDRIIRAVERLGQRVDALHESVDKQTTVIADNVAATEQTIRKIGNEQTAQSDATIDAIDDVLDRIDTAQQQIQSIETEVHNLAADLYESHNTIASEVKSIGRTIERD